MEWLRQCIEVVDRFAWENKILGSKYTLAGISLECIVFPRDLLRENGDLFLGMNKNPYKRISKNSLVFSLTVDKCIVKTLEIKPCRLGSRIGGMKAPRYCAVDSFSNPEVLAVIAKLQ